MQEQEGQIQTDWLVADWHDKEKPRRRRRRNILPDAYKSLSKEEDVPVHEGREPAPTRKGSVSGKLVDPDEVRKLEPLAKDLLRLGSPETGRSSRAMVVAEDVQMTLAIVRSCTLHRNPDGSMPLKRIWAIWDAAYAAGDTSRAFCYHRFKAVRDMLSGMGLLEWEDSTYRFGRACRWKASEELMRLMEEELASGSTATTPCSSPIVDRNNIQDAIAEARRKRPDQVGLRPKMVFPSLLRTDWDSERREAGLENLARQAA